MLLNFEFVVMFFVCEVSCVSVAIMLLNMFIEFS